MPISQKTILLVHGELTQLAAKIEQLYDDALKAGETRTFKELASYQRYLLGELRKASQEAHMRAIAALLDDEPSLPINPLTGELK